MRPLQQLVADFRKHTGLSSDKQLPCMFTFDGNLNVTCQEDGATALLSGEVIVLDKDNVSDPDTILRSLLQLNMVRMYEQQDILCLDKDTETVLLYCRFELAGADNDLFSQHLEEFVNSLELWCDTALILNRGSIPSPQSNFTFLVP